MTYYSKYLKYKNKYIVLKNIIGGNDWDDSILNRLHQEPERDRIRLNSNSIFYNKFDGFRDCIHGYSWIGPPADNKDGLNYGNGFFIFNFGFHSDLCKEQTKSEPISIRPLLDKRFNDTFKMYNTYGMLKIDVKNIGEIELMTGVSPDIIKRFKEYKTIKAIPLRIEEEEKTIKAELAASEVFRAAERAAERASKAVQAAEKKVKEVKEQKVKKAEEVTKAEEALKAAQVLKAAKIADESNARITLSAARKKAKEYYLNINIFNTSIELPIKGSSDKLPKDTNYMWDGNNDQWIYQSGDKYYKAKLII